MAISKPFFVRPLDLGTVFDSNPDPYPGHLGKHVNRPEQIGLTWKTDDSDSGRHRLSGDLGQETEIDFCAVLSANAQAGTTIRVFLTNDPTYTTPIYDVVEPFIDPSIVRSDGVYNSHHQLPSSVTARYWWIEIDNHTGDFEASAIVLGKKITPSRFYNFDFEMGVEDLGSVEVGRFGVVDEVPGQILRTLAFTLGWQTRDEFEESFRPMMEELGTRGIVYFCMRPDATTLRQANTYMGFMRKPGHARGIRKPETLTQEFELLSLI